MVRECQRPRRQPVQQWLARACAAATHNSRRSPPRVWLLLGCGCRQDGAAAAAGRRDAALRVDSVAAFPLPKLNAGRSHPAPARPAQTPGIALTSGPRHPVLLPLPCALLLDAPGTSFTQRVQPCSTASLQSALAWHQSVCAGIGGRRHRSRALRRVRGGWWCRCVVPRPIRDAVHMAVVMLHAASRGSESKSGTPATNSHRRPCRPVRGAMAVLAAPGGTSRRKR